MVRGSGSRPAVRRLDRRARRPRCVAATAGLAGPVRSGRGTGPTAARWLTRNGHWPVASAGPTMVAHADHLRAPTGSPTRIRSSAGRWSVPRWSRPASGSPSWSSRPRSLSRLVPAGRRRFGRARRRRVIWVLAARRRRRSVDRRDQPAGGDRRHPSGPGRRRRPPVARMLSSLPADVIVATDVMPNERPADPRAGGRAVRCRGRPRAGSARSDPPRRQQLGDADAGRLDADRVSRSIGSTATPERVRRWLTEQRPGLRRARLRARSSPTDASIPRSPLCAVITPAQIPAWFEALPRQRSLTAGRRDHLLARVRDAAVPRRR